MFEKFLPELVSAVCLTEKNSPLTRRSYGRRIVQYCELELITDGSGEMIVGQELLPTIPGRLFIRKPGMQTEGFTPYFSYFIVFSDNSLDFCNLELPLCVDGMASLIPYFKTIHKNFIYPTDSSRLEINSCILHIIAVLMRENTRHTPYAIADSVEYIKNHLTDLINIPVLAKNAGYSVNHYIRLFKNVVGETPANFIKKYKIQKSCELLEATNETVEQISLKCGFNSLSYFFRSFKEMIGQTPHEYRRSIRIYKE